MALRKIIQTLLDDNESLIEYLLEGDEEFTPKAEAIRLAAGGEIDAIVVRPKKGAPYLRAKNDKTKNNNLRELAVKRTCGPEIGIPLRDALYRVKQKFENRKAKVVGLIKQRLNCATILAAKFHLAVLTRQTRGMSKNYMTPVRKRRHC